MGTPGCDYKWREGEISYIFGQFFQFHTKTCKNTNAWALQIEVDSGFHEDDLGWLF